MSVYFSTSLMPTATATAWVSPSATGLPTPVPSSDTPTLATQIVVTIFCVLFGPLFAFFGYRVFKLVCFVCGFIIGYLLWYIFSPQFITTSICCGPNGEEWVHILTSCAIGLVLGLLTLCLLRLGIFFVGTILGMLIATIVMATPAGTSSFFQGNLAYGLFYALMALAFGILAVCLEKLIIILATSIAGSFAMIMAVDIWLQSNFAQAIGMFFTRVGDCVAQGFKSRTMELNLNFTWSTEDYIMLTVWVILSIVAIIVQFRCTGRRHHREGKQVLVQQPQKNQPEGMMQPLLQNPSEYNQSNIV